MAHRSHPLFIPSWIWTDVEVKCVEKTGRNKPHHNLIDHGGALGNFRQQNIKHVERGMKLPVRRNMGLRTACLSLAIGFEMTAQGALRISLFYLLFQNADYHIKSRQREFHLLELHRLAVLFVRAASI
jgi:hypothetical protein